MNNKQNKIAPAGMVIICCAVVGLCMIFYGSKVGAAIPALIGAGIFVFGIIAGDIVQTIIDKKNGRAVGGVSAKSSKKTGEKYLPLLLDERTKQHPEIQRLLQYIEVQKAFFDPSYIGTAQAQSEPHVQELMGVLDDIIAAQTMSGVSPLPNGGTPLGSAYDPRAEKQRRKKERNKPRRVIGRIFIAIGFLLVIMPFLTVAFTRVQDGFQSMAAFTIAPMGFAFLTVGTIMKNMK